MDYDFELADIRTKGYRIKGGIKDTSNEAPYIVDVSGVCSGSIIGKKHILSAAHCFDDWCDSPFWTFQLCFQNFNDEYHSRNWVAVRLGTETNGYPNTKAYYRQKIEGIGFDKGNSAKKHVVEFPVWPRDSIVYHRPIYQILGFAAKPNYRVRENLIDIALITLTESITFKDNLVQAQLAPPNTPEHNCDGCIGYCDDKNIFTAFGLGKKSEGNI